MKVIPGWVYIMLGIFMIISSKLINTTTKNSKMSVFFIVGIIFLIIGVGKYILANFLEERRQKAQAKMQGQPMGRGLYQQLAQRPSQAEVAAANPQPAHSINLLQRQRAPRIDKRLDEPYSIESAQNQQHLSIITCPVCGTKHYSYANFCMRCGSRMQK
jgi:hypothetical protein